MKKKPYQYIEFSREYIATKISVFNNPISPHWHNHIEIDMVTAGSGKLKINNTPYAFRRGSLSIILSPDTHSYSMNEISEVYHLSFNKETVVNETLKFIINNSKSIYLELNEEEIEYYISLYKMIQKEHSNPGQFSYSHEIAVFEALVFYIFSKIRNITSNTKNSDVITTAVNYIDEHFREELKIRDIANMIYLSEKHFSKKFKSELGIGFSEYLINKRLAFAAGLLAGNTQSISTISSMSGFNSPSYFNRQFMKKYGTSPSTFRKLHR